MEILELMQGTNRLVVGTEKSLKRYIAKNNISTGHVYVYNDHDYRMYWYNETDELPEVLSSFDIFDL